MELNEMKDVLGIPQEIEDFTDGKARTAYPVSMLNFPDFLKYFSQINLRVLWNNFVLDEGKVALTRLMELTFKDCSAEDVMDNINARNYPTVIKTIMAINGIEFKRKEEDGSDPNKGEV